MLDRASIVGIVLFASLGAGCSQFVAPDGGGDVVDAPGCDAHDAARPLYPPSGSVFTSRTVQFKWAANSGDWVVETCRDRACSNVVARGQTASSQVVVRDVPVGALFWRVVSASCASNASIAWQLYVEQGVAASGSAWSTPLDLNGDGFGDLAVSESGTGHISIFLGSTAGLAATPPGVLSGSTGSTFEPTPASLGDVNGDGVGDVGASDQDGIHIFLGSSPTFSALESQFIRSPAGPGSYPRMAGAGDLNGDGYADLVVGTPFPSVGGAWVFFGRAGGFSGSPDVTIPPPPGVRRFGNGVAGAGDLNGDGFSDVVVSSAQGGMGGTNDAIVYLGSATGPDLARPIRLSQGPASAGGGSATGAGDVNGDGFPDLLFTDTCPGSTVYLGGAAATPSLFARLPTACDPIGAGMDTNGDGFDDVLVTRTITSGFVADLFLGGSHGLSMGWSTTVAGTGGLALASGDFNGDGFADVVIGAPGASEVQVFNGSRSGLPSSPSTTLRGVGGSGFGAAFALNVRSWFERARRLWGSRSENRYGSIRGTPRTSQGDQQDGVVRGTLRVL